MYRDSRPVRKMDIEIDVDTYDCVCGGCPMIYDFKDSEGTNYYFRLRNGYARIVCEDTDKTLLSGGMNGFDGVCDWDDVLEWASRQGVLLNY